MFLFLLILAKSKVSIPYDFPIKYSGKNNLQKILRFGEIEIKILRYAKENPHMKMCGYIQK